MAGSMSVKAKRNREVSEASGGILLYRELWFSTAGRSLDSIQACSVILCMVTEDEIQKD
ncbi:hypothetical protein PAXINDRAFT_16415 [Paxillus involutus ATCC 200175]|uniref:Uncharacterized protein n=1 Tax=Paxillus involutus ATCC 200175 TaxID=664439 RepID=A0A0C9TRY5_PAXIN|nr:hypothetical protein PAXINDRAFT_16415 [Paxillus involutus ATCC 200175]